MSDEELLKKIRKLTTGRIPDYKLYGYSYLITKSDHRERLVEFPVIEQRRAVIVLDELPGVYLYIELPDSICERGMTVLAVFYPDDPTTSKIAKYAMEVDRAHASLMEGVQKGPSSLFETYLLVFTNILDEIIERRGLKDSLGKDPPVVVRDE